jgi:hypothetical protein
MKKKYPSERAAELFNKAIDALKRVEDAPNSPIGKFHNAKERRELRRNVLQLRRGQIPPQFTGVKRAEEFAEVLLVTIQRDQTVEAATRDFKSTERELDQIGGKNPEACAETFRMMYDEAVEGALRNGPASEDAQRVRLMQLIASLGQSMGTKMRRRNESHPVHLTRRFKTDHAFLRRFVSDEPETSGEPVLAFPADGDGDPARERAELRISIGDESWVATFEKGDTEHSVVHLLPDGKHLLVSAYGAGYLIDVESRTLVERIGNDIASVGDAYMGSVVFVNHGDRSFEAFGIPGRLWKTDAISCGGFRALDVEGETFVGEARRDAEGEWTRFSVSLATGEVSWPPSRRAAT